VRGLGWLNYFLISLEAVEVTLRLGALERRFLLALESMPVIDTFSFFGVSSFGVDDRGFTFDLSLLHNFDVFSEPAPCFL